MTLTRSKTGTTPRRPNHPDFVETPATRRRSRKSVSNGTLSKESTVESSETKTPRTEKKANGSVRSTSTRRKTVTAPASKAQAADPKVDQQPVYEFGGSWGVTAMMIGFPLLMYYMWIGSTYYDGKLPLPKNNESYMQFLKHLVHLAYTGAFPHAKAWIIFWVFFVTQALFYLYMPGVYTHGKPLGHLGGKSLQYYCSGVWSFYTSTALVMALHFTGAFPLYTLIDEFGPLMSVAIISGFLISFVAWFSALARGAEHRMTGYPVYDFFMGAELNPRLFGWLDFKMFFEVRLPWFILFYVSLGACARQYEQFGFVSGELGFLLMAHFLYANACCKGEELIPTTWDMYYEKWGFMLIFWNIAGVPLSYCHCTIYLVNHAPSTYKWHRAFLAFLYVSYLFAYYIWDTAGSQKNYFRGSQRGTARSRKTFPQLPWRIVENPQTIPVEGGDDLLVDGWYKYARKIHYTCDMYFAITWALVTGFGSPFPWFYPVFFALMITHRAYRDIQKCRSRYGAAWKEYERRVPYLFIPYVI